MKLVKKYSLLMIAVLVIAGVASACTPASAATNSAPVANASMTTSLDMGKTIESFIKTLPDGFYGIKAADALKAIQSDPKPFVIDLRDSKEITQTIQGAVAIPIRTLTQNLNKLPAQDQPIIVFCASGHRGSLAVEALQLLGYKNVKSVLSGLNGWRAANLPLVDGQPAAPQVISQAPQADPNLLSALDKFIANLPDGFYAAAATTAAKDLASDSKPFLIDVREPSELAAGYIDGAVNIPLRSLFLDMSKLPQDKNTPILTYCTVGQRGGIAMMALRLAGYNNVRSIGGGLNGWVKANLPIKKA